MTMTSKAVAMNTPAAPNRCPARTPTRVAEISWHIRISRSRGLRNDSGDSAKRTSGRGARPLVRLAESPESFLNPLLLLILMCQLISATLVGVLAGHLFGAAGVFIATALEVIVIFVVFEAIPKNFAVQHLDSTALITAPIVSAMLRFWPIKWLS